MIADGSYLLFVATSLWGATIGLVLVARHFDQLSRDNGRVTFRLEFPASLTLVQATAVMRSLTMMRPSGRWLLGRDSVVFEVVREGPTIEHRLRIPRQHAAQIAAQVRGLVPSVRLAPIADLVLPTMEVVRELALTAPTQPLRVDAAESFAASLLFAMGPFDDLHREQLVFQVVASPMGMPNGLPTPTSSELAIGPSWMRSLVKAIVPPVASGADVVKQARAKLSEPLFAVSLRVGARSGGVGRSGQLVGRIVGTLHQLEQPGVRFVGRRFLIPELAIDRLRRAATALVESPVRANAEELATLVGWPLGGPTAPGLQLTRGREFPPQRESVQRGYVLGRATYPGLERPVAVSPVDALMHTLISGPTGSGKSTLILNLVKQQIDAGAGLILIDPNGDLAQDVIDVIPAARIQDLIYLNPADERAVPLNPLDCALEDAELVADQILALIRDRSDSWGVIIDETLKNTLVLLAATPGMTLTEIPAVLVDEGFRTSLLSRLDRQFAPTVGEFFARFEARSAAQKAQDASAVLNKVTPLLDRRPVRAMVGQADPTWTMRQVIEERKLMVVALPSGVIGESAADIIGSTIATMVWNAAQARVTLSRADRRPVSLVIDELPRFVRGGFGLADLLARARGHGIGLVGALQHIGQVNPTLRAALLSEARNKVVFQPAADDAAVFARHLRGVQAEDLLGLAPRTALASLVVGGQVTAPVSIATYAPPAPSGHGQAARTASRTQYGRDRAAVEQAIVDRRNHGRQTGPRRTRRLP